LTWRLIKHAYATAACLLTTKFKVALQVESTICHLTERHQSSQCLVLNEK
jgi:hypothetical protein